MDEETGRVALETAENSLKSEYFSAPKSETQTELMARLMRGLSRKSVTIQKTQSSFLGRAIYLPILAVLATVIYLVCMWGTNWAKTSDLRVEIRYFLLFLESIIYAAIMATLVMRFVVDIMSSRKAETIQYLESENGEKFYNIEGKYCRKFEYSGGNIVVFGGKTYDKYVNKSAYNALSSRYDKALGRRSVSSVVLSAEFLCGEIMRGEITSGENFISATTQKGVMYIAFDGENISRIDFEGKGDDFYDSFSPTHFIDGKMPLKYKYSYTFFASDRTSLVVPALVETAIKDFLMPQIQSDAIVFEQTNEKE